MPASLIPKPPRIKISGERKLVGKRLVMSFADYRVVELWKSFMPARKDIVNRLANDLISLTVYKPTYFADFRPTNEFEKWATAEVSDFDYVPAISYSTALISFSRSSSGIFSPTTMPFLSIRKL